MAKPKPNPSFWPNVERTPFDSKLYSELEHGPYATLAHSVFTHLAILRYVVPFGPGLWDGLVDGFRAGILDVVQDEPTPSPARLSELKTKYGQRFSADVRQPDIHQKVYVYAYAIGLEDAGEVKKKLTLVRTPERLATLLTRLYYHSRVPRSDYVDDALPISLFDHREKQIEGYIATLLVSPPN